MLARCYLRASTSEQDATRARAQVEAFAADRGLTIVGTYVENESGAKLARPDWASALAMMSRHSFIRSTVWAMKGSPSSSAAMAAR